MSNKIKAAFLTVVSIVLLFLFSYVALLFPLVTIPAIMVMSLMIAIYIIYDGILEELDSISTKDVDDMRE